MARRQAFGLAGPVFVFLALGCGRAPAVAPPPAKPQTAPTVLPAPAKPAPVNKMAAPPATTLAPSSPDDLNQLPTGSTKPPPVAAEETPAPAAPREPIIPAPPEYSQAKLAVAGIRRIAGKHLILYTDLPAAPEVDELPAVFDLAVPQWCEYFHVSQARTAHYICTAYLMKERDRFAASGLWRADLPPFLHGYQRGLELWLYDQPSAYYRRHLLLHEGTHAFMHLWLDGAGPPWFSEGVAELCGTHRWAEGKLTLRYMPRSKEEVPHWGRVKIIKDEFAANRGMTLEAITGYSATAHLKNEPYGWCWAAAQFLDTHPQTQTMFRDLFPKAHNTAGKFSQQFLAQLEPEAAKINEDWQLYVMNMEYGYNVAQAAVVRKAAVPLPAAGGTARVEANRGWQSSGLRLEAGKLYHISASGRYQVGQKPQPWECEPGGLTVHYYQGQPLGILLAAIRNDETPPEGVTPLARPGVIGLGRAITPATSGTLYLKINESAADLEDNSGTLAVRVTSE